MALEWISDPRDKRWVRIRVDSSEKFGFIFANNLGLYRYDCKSEKRKPELSLNKLDFELFTARDGESRKDVVIQDFERGFVNYKDKLGKSVLEIEDRLEIYDQRVISTRERSAISQLTNIEDLSDEERDDIFKDKLGLPFKYGKQWLMVATIHFKIVPGLEKVRVIPDEKNGKLFSTRF